MYEPEKLTLNAKKVKHLNRALTKWVLVDFLKVVYGRVVRIACLFKIKLATQREWNSFPKILSDFPYWMWMNPPSSSWGTLVLILNKLLLLNFMHNSLWSLNMIVQKASSERRLSKVRDCPFLYKYQTLRQFKSGPHRVRQLRAVSEAT